MPVLTKGHVSVKPLRLTTSASLDEVFEVLSEVSRSVSKDGGWGSLSDETEILSSYGVRPLTVGRPVMSIAEGATPRRLKVRRYWWQLDRSALRFVGSDSENALRLSACDLIVSEMPDGGDSLLILASLRDVSLLSQHVREPLLSVFDDAKLAASTLEIDQSPLGEFEPDFFLWLMYKFHHSPALTTDISIAYLRDMSGLDGSDRSTRLKNGVSLDRAELLAMIMGGLTSFGPASFEIQDDAIGLYGALNLFPDGSFSPLVGSSSYEHTLPSDQRPLGERLAEDLAYKVLPELRTAHREDADWTGEQRAAYVGDAGRSLRAVLSTLIPNSG